MIEPIKKVKVSEEVFLHMKQQIIDKEWKSGEKLPSEAELGKLFDVSRITIRNALQKLVALDLVETHLGDGTYVKQNAGAANFNNLVPTAYFETDVEMILEFRREIESSTCAIAAKKATEKDIAGLREKLDYMESLQGDREKLALADLEFHYMIASISRNPLIIKTYEIVLDIYTSHMKRIVMAMGGEKGQYYHRKIVDVIEEHDTTKAREHMYEHIGENEIFLNTLLKKEAEKSD